MYTPKARAINLKNHFCVRFDDFRTDNTCKWQLEMEKEGSRDQYEMFSAKQCTCMYSDALYFLYPKHII